LGERWLCKPEVVGSIPISSTDSARIKFLRLSERLTLCKRRGGVEPPLLIEN
jgi:hypothetical protein